MIDRPARRFPIVPGASFAALLLAATAAGAQQLPPDVLEQVAGTADALSPLAVLAPLGISPFLALGLLGAGAHYTELVLPSNLVFVGHPALWIGLLALAVLLHIGRSFKLSKPLVELLGTSESMIALVALAAMFVTPEVGASEGTGDVVEASLLGTGLMVAGAVSGLMVVIVVRMGFDLLTWLSPIPFVDALLQLAKLVATVALVAVAVLAPALAVVLNLALLVAAVLAGRWLLRVARFGTRLLWDASIGRFGQAPLPVADGRVGPLPVFALGNDCRLPWLGPVEVSWEAGGWRAHHREREDEPLGASVESVFRRGLVGTVLTTPRARLVVTARYHRELRYLAELTGTPLSGGGAGHLERAETRPA